MQQNEGREESIHWKREEKSLEFWISWILIKLTVNIKCIAPFYIQNFAFFPEKSICDEPHDCCHYDSSQDAINEHHIQDEKNCLEES